MVLFALRLAPCPPVHAVVVYNLLAPSCEGKYNNQTAYRLEDPTKSIVLNMAPSSSLAANAANQIMRCTVSPPSLPRLPNELKDKILVALDPISTHHDPTLLLALATTCSQLRAYCRDFYQSKAAWKLKFASFKQLELYVSCLTTKLPHSHGFCAPAANSVVSIAISAVDAAGDLDAVVNSLCHFPRLSTLELHLPILQMPTGPHNAVPWFFETAEKRLSYHPSLRIVILRDPVLEETVSRFYTMPARLRQGLSLRMTDRRESEVRLLGLYGREFSLGLAMNRQIRRVEVLEIRIRREVRRERAMRWARDLTHRVIW